MIEVALKYIGLVTVTLISISIISLIISLYFDNKAYSIIEHDDYHNNDILKYKKLKYFYLREVFILFTPGFYTSKHEEIKEEMNDLKYNSRSE